MSATEEHPLWRAPHHHMDREGNHNHVHWMELFYDLIHVVMVFMLGNFLAEHHDFQGWLAFALIFSAVWLAWGESSIYNSIYVSTDVVYRVSTAAQTLSVLFMAASITELGPSFNNPGAGLPYFLAAYGLNRLVLAYMYWRTVRVGAEKGSLARTQAIRFALLASWYGLAALLPAPINTYMLIAGVLATQLLYMIPGLSILSLERFQPRYVHFAERYALLLLIVNGEAFFKLVVTLSEKGISQVGWQVLTNVGLGSIGAFGLTWLYFGFVGNLSPKQEKLAHLYAYWLGHLFLMMGAVMIGVAMAGEVYVGFMESFPTYYGFFGCYGLMLFLVSLGVIQWSVEPALAHEYATYSTLAMGLILAIVTLFTFPHVPSFVGNFLWFSALLVPLVVPINRAHKKLIRQATN